MVYAISLPFIGNTVGLTEMGRQPWVVSEDAGLQMLRGRSAILVSFTSLF